LKHLLREAKQRVPPFLEALEDPSEKLGLAGGLYYVFIVININITSHFNSKLFFFFVSV
jgi:hypothetical protein